jgi:hypothetical protein
MRRRLRRWDTRFLPVRTDVTQGDAMLTLGKQGAARLAVKPEFTMAGAVAQ